MSAATIQGTPDLNRVQRLRKRVLAALAAMLIGSLPVTASVFGPETAMHETIESVGFGLILMCVLGRTWSALYIGGRKRETVVTDGPYSLVRNPLYLFSVMGAGGIGMTTGSVLFGIAFALVAFLVFEGVVRSEETWLKSAFGADFAAYAARVRRWRPRLSGWHDAYELPVHPRLVLTTFRDASLFLLAVPLSEGIDHLQEAGHLPVLLQLP
jgi:protein-S-isoprenylcysteine O-methyltransferase Ste14